MSSSAIVCVLTLLVLIDVMLIRWFRDPASTMEEKITIHTSKPEKEILLKINILTFTSIHPCKCLCAICHTSLFHHIYSTRYLIEGWNSQDVPLPKLGFLVVTKAQFKILCKMIVIHFRYFAFAISLFQLSGLFVLASVHTEVIKLHHFFTFIV